MRGNLNGNKKGKPLLTEQEAKRKYGALIGTTQAENMTGLTWFQLIYRIQNGTLPRETYLIANIDFIPKIKTTKYLFVRQPLVDYFRGKENRLPRIEEIEKQHGKLLTQNNAADRLNIHRDSFCRYMKVGLFRDYYFVGGEDINNDKKRDRHYFIPEKNLNKIGSIISLNRQKASELSQNRSLISDDYFARAARIPLDELVAEIENGDWDDAVYESCYAQKGRKMYFLIKERLQKRRYTTLAQISERLGMTLSTLYRYIDLGDLVQPEHLKGTRLWDSEEIKQKLPYIQKKYANRMGGIRELKLFDMLNDDLQTLIEDYINYRKMVVFIEIYFLPRSISLI